MLSALGPIQKAGVGWGGGGCCPLQVRYGKREGGGGGVLSSALGPIQKAGKGGGGEKGCLAEKGAVPYMKGGVATPKPPPPGSASEDGSDHVLAYLYSWVTDYANTSHAISL